MGQIARLIDNVFEAPRYTVHFTGYLNEGPLHTVSTCNLEYCPALCRIISDPGCSAVSRIIFQRTPHGVGSLQAGKSWAYRCGSTDGNLYSCVNRRVVVRVCVVSVRRIKLLVIKPIDSVLTGHILAMDRYHKSFVIPDSFICVKSFVRK